MVAWIGIGHLLSPFLIFWNSRAAFGCGRRFDVGRPCIATVAAYNGAVDSGGGSCGVDCSDVSIGGCPVGAGGSVSQRSSGVFSSDCMRILDGCSCHSKHNTPFHLPSCRCPGFESESIGCTAWHLPSTSFETD